MLSKQQHSRLIILIDPDKYNSALIEMANNCKVSYLFVGGSVLKKNTLKKTIKSIKSLTQIPVIIFPGSFDQLSHLADALLIPSLISGRNTDYLIDMHVKAAKKIKATKLRCISMGYILVDGHSVSVTQKITKTKPLAHKKEIIETAIAGELLGQQLIYLEAGSGAKKTLTNSIIKAVKKNISVPLIIGGGIDSYTKAKQMISASPDYMVIGNALEKNPNLLLEINNLF